MNVAGRSGRITAVFEDSCYTTAMVKMGDGANKLALDKLQVFLGALEALDPATIRSWARSAFSRALVSVSVSDPAGTSARMCRARTRSPVVKRPACSS